MRPNVYHRHLTIGMPRKHIPCPEERFDPFPCIFPTTAQYELSKDIIYQGKSICLPCWNRTLKWWTGTLGGATSKLCVKSDWNCDHNTDDKYPLEFLQINFESTHLEELSAVKCSRSRGQLAVPEQSESVERLASFSLEHHEPIKCSIPRSTWGF